MVDEIDAQLKSLVLHPREDLHIEMKTWLDLDDKRERSTLAKAMIALANHGGGFVVIGFEEHKDGSFSPSKSRPQSLEMYSQDAVAGVVSKYASPTFHCSVKHIQHPNTGDVFPIVVVPGGHRTPIQCVKGSPDNKSLQSGRYYIRRHGPRSEEPREPNEWNDLVMRCVRAGKDDLLDALRDVLSPNFSLGEDSGEPSDETVLNDWLIESESAWLNLGHNDNENQIVQRHGHYRVGYKILGDFDQPSLPQLKQIINRSTVRHSGWSPFWVPNRPGIRPIPKDGYIECSLVEDPQRLIDDPGHSDFWRVSQEGLAVLYRGFNEDGVPEKLVPGSSFSITTPIWRIGESVLQAAAFAKNLTGNEVSILFRTDWTGLKGRTLVTMDGWSNSNDGREATADTLTRTVRFDPRKLDNNLPDLLWEFLKPLYAVFDFMELDLALVREELNKLMRNKF